MNSITRTLIDLDASLVAGHDVFVIETLTKAELDAETKRDAAEFTQRMRDEDPISASNLPGVPTMTMTDAELQMYSESDYD